MKILITALIFGLVSIAANATDEVHLLKAQSIVNHNIGVANQGRFEVLVANIGYTKQVNIHLKRADGSWVDFPLSYSRAASSGKEVWAANFNSLAPLPTTTDPLVFAVSYSVNGQTYWDSNNGANYSLARDGGSALVSTNVYNASYLPVAIIQGPYFTLNGYVTLKNLAPAKNVKVYYSTDNWKTTSIAVASYSASFWANSGSYASNPNAYGFEEWSYMLDVGQATQVAYAISYTVNGVTYWDNNFGNNYVTQLTPP